MKHSLFGSLLVALCLFWTSLSQPCPNDCSGRGRCTLPGQICECFHGFIGGDCSERACPQGLAWADVAVGVDNAHNLAECSNQGICNRQTGACSCQNGFEGSACERMSCPSECNSHGRCQSMEYYASNRDPGEILRTSISDFSLYSYNSIWDARKIYGCNCDDNYFNYDCLLRKCPTGDDPLTGVGVSAPALGNPNQVNEIQKIVCKAGGGTFTLSFRNKSSKPIPYNANVVTLTNALNNITSIGAGGVNIILQSTTTACTPEGSSWTVEFLQQYGSLPRLVPNATGLVFLTAAFSPFITVTEQVQGTREDVYCSNRGVCDFSTGVCTCAPNFITSNGLMNNDARDLQPGTRGDCGFPQTTIQVCPGTISCSGHGQCVGNPTRTYKCICSQGWTGADCSLRTCPRDVSWFAYPTVDNVAHLYESVECSNRGTCDRALGTCACQSGFSGAACEFMSCPGTLQECNGHGQCLDMATLARTFGTVYGSIPNNPNTWDASKVMGCLCDYPYSGYDCSIYECPLGDDPLTINQVNEIQKISCTDANSAGSIVLQLGRFISKYPLTPTSTYQQVKVAIENIQFAGEVLVSNITGSGTLCSPSGSALKVEFLSRHGSVPLITTYRVTGIDSFVVSPLQRSTKEYIPCSSRGLCDTSTGICNCFDGFVSSDGKGNIGTRGDCGYANPVQQS